MLKPHEWAKISKKAYKSHKNLLWKLLKSPSNVVSDPCLCKTKTMLNRPGELWKKISGIKSFISDS